MLYRIAADLLVLIHLAFIIYVVLGGALAFKWRWSAWLHLPCALWGVLIEFFGWVCPLTPWEIALRRAAGQAGYRGGFVAHYILPIIYPAELTRSIQILLGVVVLVINACIYGILLALVSRRHRQ